MADTSLVAGSVTIPIKADTTLFDRALINCKKEAIAFDQTVSKAGNASNFRQLTADADKGAIAMRGVSEAAKVEAGAIAVSKAGHIAHGAAVGLSTSQMMALTHTLRGFTEQVAMGQSPLRALTSEFSHLTYLMSGPGGVNGLLGGIGELFGPFVPLLAGIGVAVAGISLIFAGLTTKINETAKTQVNFGNVFMATIDVAAKGLADAFGPPIKQVGGWFQQLVDWLAPAFKGVINFVVGFFAQGFQHAVASWDLLPQALGELAIDAFNGISKSLEDMLNNSRGKIIQFMVDAGTLLGPFGATLNSGALALAQAGKISLPQLNNPFTGTDKFIAGQTDYAGNTFDAISKQAQALELASQKTKKAKDGLKDLSNGIAYVTKQTNQLALIANSAFQDLGTSIVDAFTKGGNVVVNVLDAMLDKIKDLGTSLLNAGLNSIVNGLFPTSFIGGSVGSAPLRLGYQAGVGGGLFGGSIIPGVLHGGGTAGQDGYNHTRRFPLSTWQGAPRFHLGTDEVPAILQRGERVIAANQNRSSNGQRAVMVNVTNHITGSRVDAAEIARQTTKQIKTQVPDMIAAYNRNSYRRTGNGN